MLFAISGDYRLALVQFKNIHSQCIIGGQALGDGGLLLVDRGGIRVVDGGGAVILGCPAGIGSSTQYQLPTPQNSCSVTQTIII